MKLKIKIIFYTTIVIIIIAQLLWIFKQRDKIKELEITDTEYQKTIQESQNKEKELRKIITILRKDYEQLIHKKDSINTVLSTVQNERIIIENEIDNQINDVTNISLDSNLQFLSDRLSQIEFN
tara:strand:- start:1852 stop:2223 length:372 start_codon:yes stop_codon:yes gene_type:complete